MVVGAVSVFGRDDGVVVMPVRPRPGWAPAWAPLRIGETRRRGLCVAQWALGTGLTLTGVALALDPLLLMGTPPVVTGGLVLFDLAALPAATPGTELQAALTLSFAEDAALDFLVVIRQPVRAGAPAGLVTTGVGGPLPPAVLTDANGPVVDGDGLVLSETDQSVVADETGVLVDETGPVISS